MWGFPLPQIYITLKQIITINLIKRNFLLENLSSYYRIIINIYNYASY
jgi:hypothetical protein